MNLLYAAVPARVEILSRQSEDHDRCRQMQIVGKGGSAHVDNESTISSLYAEEMFFLKKHRMTWNKSTLFQKNKVKLSHKNSGGEDS